MQAKVEKKAGKKNKTLQHMWKDRVLYLMLAPTLIYFLIFRVWPIINMRLAFCNYRAKGPWEFAGLKYFDMIFKSSTFMEILRNTLIISFMKYILLFPFFVIFALLLNEIRCGKFRKYVQIISYMPHFLSWVVIAGIWISMLSVSGGAVNQIMGWFGLDAVDFMTNKGTIRWVLFFSEWLAKPRMGFLVYFTAILAISPDLYEAATVDGAKRIDIIRYIILPALVVPMTTMFILNLGFFMTAGFDQVFNFTNQSVNSVIDILDTYVYRIGLESGQYSLATAVALIKGIVGVFLVLVTHLVSKKVTGKGVW